jgi:hypothetical protein
MKKGNLILVFMFLFVTNFAGATEEALVSLINVYTGQLTTIYGGSGEYAYAYPAYAFSDDPSRQNFRIEYRDNNTIRFKVTQYGTCLRQYLSGVVDYECDSVKANDWKIIPVISGAVQLKNMGNNLCLTLSSPGSGYSNLGYNTCATGGAEADSKQLWIIGAPRGSSASVSL